MEEVIETPDELHMWGEMDGVDKKFGTATPAKGASVTLTMDANVQTAADLDGKSFTIKVNYSTYDFRFSTSSTSNGYTKDNETGEYYYRIGISGCNTVQEAFDKFCDYSNSSNAPWSQPSHMNFDKESTQVNGNTVTLFFTPIDLREEITADGNSTIYETAGGDGSKANGVIFSSIQEANLKPVDSLEDYLTVSGTFQLLPGVHKDTPLTEEMKATLLNNRLYFYVSDNAKSITFTNNPTTQDRVVSLNVLTTVGDLRDAIKEQISKMNIFSVSDIDDNGNFTLEGKHTTGSVYLWEYANADSNTTSVNTNSLDVSIATVQSHGPEWPQITEITLPNDLPDTDTPFSLSIKGTTYTFYDGSNIPPNSTITSSGTAINIAGKTKEEIFGLIAKNIASQYSDASVVLTENTIRITAQVSNKKLDIAVAGVSTKFSYAAKGAAILLGDGTSNYVSQYFRNYSLELDLSDAVNSGLPLSEALNGHGFKLNGNYYQFGTTSTLNNVTLVDISSCNTIEQVGNVLKDIIKLKESNVSSTVDINVPSGSNKLIISATAKNTYSNLNFNDGLNGKDGLFGDVVGQTTTATASGGTKIGNPSASISFSGYNKDNFHELYGKGFRVTCATCPGEYINVIFCYDKDQCSFPESFNITIEENGQRVERTIHNMVVELKEMNDGSDIVNSIVTQLRYELDHYTEVAIGTPSSVLKVFDIRSGDRYLGDPANGELQQAEILSGVYTNCIYTVTPNFIPAPDAVVGDIEIDFRNVEIFADANNDDGYIKIHLPYLTLENLKLDPPKPDFSTPEKALETLDRVLNAHNAVSYIRGTIGADYNRLEHAFASLTQATIQTTDAFSRIRDTDMAKAMMEQVKNSVLQNAQQSMQVHAQNMPQSVLQLLKG